MKERKVLMIAVEDASPDPHQPRQHFGKEELERMAASIAARGVLQPIRVPLG